MKQLLLKRFSGSQYFIRKEHESNRKVRNGFEQNADV